MRTVAAFANGDGGALLFGVDDDGEITGIPPKEAGAAIDRLTNLIRDTVRPLPVFRAEIIETAGRYILVLTVEPGEQLPCGVGADRRDVRYYIRRAASTFPASPDDLRALIQTREPQATLMFPPRVD
jgi:predicted HTH transcriptional regulator